MDIKRQIERGLLVCPKTKQKLMIDNQFLVNTENTERYKFLDGRIPILLEDTKWAEEYAIDSESMNIEYAIDYINKKKCKYSVCPFMSQFFNKSLNFLRRGYTQISLMGTLIFPGGPSCPRPFVCPTLIQLAAL